MAHLRNVLLGLDFQKEARGLKNFVGMKVPIRISEKPGLSFQDNDIPGVVGLHPAERGL